MLHPAIHRDRPRQRGFTLIELMIAVVVVAILSALAFPSFMGSIRKGRRSEAFAAVSAVQQAQERWRANNAAYATNLTAAPTADPAGLGLSSTTASGYYTIAIAAAAAASYEVTATAVSGTSQANDSDCAKLGVKLTGGNLEYGSASASGTLSYAATNKCWSR